VAGVFLEIQSRFPWFLTFVLTGLALGGTRMAKERSWVSWGEVFLKSRIEVCWPGEQLDNLKYNRVNGALSIHWPVSEVSLPVASGTC
jgi:hypothetical protein